MLRREGSSPFVRTIIVFFAAKQRGLFFYAVKNDCFYTISVIFSTVISVQFFECDSRIVMVTGGQYEARYHDQGY